MISLVLLLFYFQKKSKFNYIKIDERERERERERGNTWDVVHILEWCTSTCFQDSIAKFLHTYFFLFIGIISCRSCSWTRSIYCVGASDKVLLQEQEAGMIYFIISWNSIIIDHFIKLTLNKINDCFKHYTHSSTLSRKYFRISQHSQFAKNKLLLNIQTLTCTCSGLE